MHESDVARYGEMLFGGEDEVLRSMREDATNQGLPRIQVPLELGRLVQVLLSAVRARTALEIGTLFGYSGVWIARALGPEGRLTTLEVDAKHAALARQNFRRAGVGDRVTILEGPALDSLTQLDGQSFDFVLIDADKPSYPEYLEWSLKLTHSGSVIVADNVWRGGAVLGADEDEAAQAMAKFNEAVASNSALISTIVPSRGGGDAAMVSVVRGRQTP